MESVFCAFRCAKGKMRSGKENDEENKELLIFVKKTLSLLCSEE